MIMNKEQMNKYAYELMVKNNPDEVVKNLLLKDKEIERLKKKLDCDLQWAKKYDELFEENNRLNNIINELEKELDNLIIFNQSNITCNHYTPDDWKDSKLIGNMLYKMKPVSFLAQELKDKLKELKEGKE